MASNILDMNGAHEFKYTTTGAVTVGTLLVVGTTPMVAMEAATGSGQVISCAVGCEFSGTKKGAASTSLAAGGKAYYIVTGGVNKLTGLAAAGKLIGYATEAATTGATTAKVRLLPGPALLGSTS